ncbi:Uncharacterized protein Adt_21803 [Abeliophyllum distichum]|uniref:Transposase (putative) gypsy type domain-containing protein n=1 Tax=Abeliophyllum distichum TaxID=126358 RepID=A0ABD1T0H9_9LAMI
MVVRRVRGNNVGRTSDTPSTPLPRCSRPNLHTIPKSPSTYTENTLKRTVNHFFLSKAHNYRAPESTEYLPTGRPGEVAIYQDSLKAGLRFPLHTFLVEFFCTFNLSPGQLVSNALRMLNYYLLVCMLKGVEPSVDVFRLLFEMKPLDRYDCFVVFSHRDRGIPAHDHFKIPNCPTSNSGWKSRYFFVSPADGDFPFPLDWGVPPFEDFNTTPILTESEIDSLIILRAIAPFGRSMNDVLTDDALVFAGIGRPYDMSADKFTEDFLEELARRNSRGQRKRRRDNSSADPISSEANPAPDNQDSLSIDPSPTVLTATAQAAHTPESSRSRNTRAPVDNRQSSNIRRPIEKVAEDCQAVVACLDWEVIEASKDKTPESLERSIMVEERREKSNELLDSRRALSEKTELLEEREARIAELERLMAEHLQQSNHKVQNLEENIDRLERELVARGESAVEEYKCTDEYMTTVGMVGVRGLEMSFRKSHEWLTERYPTMDFSGVPFMPSVDDEEEDED